VAPHTTAALAGSAGDLLASVAWGLNIPLTVRVGAIACRTVYTMLSQRWFPPATLQLR
jgi:hypothetical protein